MALDKLTPSLLAEYLRVLKDAGVREFSCEELKISLGPEPTEEPKQPKAPAVTSMWKNPHLWGSGGPPKFPVNE